MGRYTLPPEYPTPTPGVEVTTAVGTHHTGMLSCNNCFLRTDQHKGSFVNHLKS